MSSAPQTLVDLRIFLAEQFEVPRKNFGITGRVTARRPWGFHLGKNDIYSDAGMKDRDYSVRNRRNKAGLTNASAGFDIKVPVGKLKRLTAYLVEKAQTGEDGGLLFEVIGPDASGAAMRWSQTNGWLPEAARRDHEWHAHLSFWRDTEFIDKRPLFHAFFGIGGDAPRPTLQLGAQGDAVKALQERLNEHGAGLVVDGDFGPLTDAAVRAFQQAQGLVIDGIVGPITWEALDTDPPPEPPPGTDPPPDEPEQPEIPEPDLEAENERLRAALEEIEGKAAAARKQEEA